jgi:hypothetical protein
MTRRALGLPGRGSFTPLPDMGPPRPSPAPAEAGTGVEGVGAATAGLSPAGPSDGRASGTREEEGVAPGLGEDAPVVTREATHRVAVGGRGNKYAQGGRGNKENNLAVQPLSPSQRAMVVPYSPLPAPPQHTHTRHEQTREESTRGDHRHRYRYGHRQGSARTWQPAATVAAGNGAGHGGQRSSPIGPRPALAGGGGRVVAAPAPGRTAPPVHPNVGQGHGDGGGGAGAVRCTPGGGGRGGGRGGCRYHCRHWLTRAHRGGGGWGAWVCLAGRGGGHHHCRGRQICLHQLQVRVSGRAYHLNAWVGCDVGAGGGGARRRQQRQGAEDRGRGSALRSGGKANGRPIDSAGKGVGWGRCVCSTYE